MNKTDLANAMQEEIIIRKGFAEIGHPSDSTVYARIWAKINTFTKTADIHINMQVQKTPGDSLLHHLMSGNKIKAALNLSSISFDNDLTEVIPVYQLAVASGMTQDQVAEKWGYNTFFLEQRTDGYFAIRKYRDWNLPNPTAGWFSIKSGDRYIVNIYNANVTF